MRSTLGTWALTVIFVSASLIGPTPAKPAEPTPDGPAVVPLEDYPLYDLMVDERFVTPEMKLVLLERQTLTRLHPEQTAPVRTETFQEYEIFDGPLPPALVRDFVFKSQTP